MTNLSMPARWRFWETFAEAVELVRDLRDETAARDFVFGMYEYASWGKEPRIDFDDKVVSRAWRMIQPNLDKTVERHAISAVGGKAKARKEKDMNNDEKKRVKKLAKAMGGVYEATVVPEYDDEDLLPDWEYESQAAFMDDDYERRRSLLQDECDAEEYLGLGD